MDTTGNNTVACAGQGCLPGTVGTIQSCGAVALQGTLTVDIIVNGIPNFVAGSGAGPNIQGYDMDLIFNGTIVQVDALPANGAGGPPTNLDMNYAGTPGGSHSSSTAVTPDATGDFFMSEIDFGAIGESGPGILMRLTLRGLAVGDSTLQIKYTTGGTDLPNIYDNSGAQNAYTFTENRPALIRVGGATCT